MAPAYGLLDRPAQRSRLGQVQRHPIKFLLALVGFVVTGAFVLRYLLPASYTSDNRSIPLIGRPFAGSLGQSADPDPADVLFNFRPGPAPSQKSDLLTWGHKGDDGNVYPPLYIPALNLAPRAKAGIMILVDLPTPPQISLAIDSLTNDVIKTIRSIENRFNRWWAYPIIVVHHVPLNDAFRRAVRGATRSEIRFAQIDDKDWNRPSMVTEKEMRQAFDKLKGVSYGSSTSYRSISRYMAGPVYSHPLLRDLDYVWRVTPGIEFYCDLDYDPLAMMALNGKKYAFVYSVHEDHRAIDGLWSATEEFFNQHPSLMAELSAGPFLSMIRPSSRSTPPPSTNATRSEPLLPQGWNNCFFSAHSEIVDANVMRSEAYQAYFDFIDAKGGIWTQRWSDETVKSLGLALLLDRRDMHWFSDFGVVQSAALISCPQDPKYHDNGKCSCAARMSTHEMGFSCIPEWQALMRS